MPVAVARRARVGRELLLAAVCLAIGMLVMPCLIFAVGSLVLGALRRRAACSRCGATFLVGLASGSQAFWFIAAAVLTCCCGCCAAADTAT